ncbi:MAG: class I SAM-dependent methyltransferase [Halobacteria archaeon]|nr:class I SAM-dependent methyltransferase [Halobacteria archaeon]
MNNKRISHIAALAYRWTHRGKPVFECPLCGYSGPFKDIRPRSGLRRHARCPQCRSMERMRLQYLAIRELMNGRDFSQCSMLHFAPEQQVQQLFRNNFDVYHTADLHRDGMDYRIDIQHMPFEDGSYDVIFASHVLEYIRDDMAALREIHRVLKPGGIAILPVPVIAEHTVDYPEPNPHEAGGHIRAPGEDYFERYRAVFSGVRLASSSDYPDRFQTWVYDDRSSWPDTMPLRPTKSGERHCDYVPICYK